MVADVTGFKSNMRYHVLATDYDGTLAKNERVSKETIEALKQLKRSRRKIILVTGREIKELELVFPEYNVFDLIVAENGALILNPANEYEILLGERPSDEFINYLRQHNVSPLSVGKVIVATWEPHQNLVLEAIKKTGLEHQIIFNKGAVMVLPPGINKAKGLRKAMDYLGISMHNVVAIGDAENDIAMLQAAECGVAVANALPSVKETAALVTKANHSDGVIELIQHLIGDDLANADTNLQKHYLNIGKNEDRTDYSISAYKDGVLVAGSSGGGKSTLTSAFLENLKEKHYQFCLIDPEGDYAELDDAVMIGSAEQPPVLDEVIKLLSDGQQNIIISLLAVDLDKRPAFFNELFPKIVELRKAKAHPHWIIIDETNHMLPAEAESSFYSIPQELNNLWLITTQPQNINKAIMQNINTIIAIGEKPEEKLRQFARIKNIEHSFQTIPSLEKGKAIVWDVMSDQQPVVITVNKPKQVSHRHIKKYASGFMDYNSFYFTGPKNKLKLNAFNVITFTQLANGVDDETWIYHLKRNDYSKWFREALHDDELAGKAEQIENSDNDAVSSKIEIIKLVKARYTEAG